MRPASSFMPGLLGASLLHLLTGCTHRPAAAVVVPPAIPAAMERQIKNAQDAGDGDYQLHRLRARVVAEPANLEARLELGQAYAQRGYVELALDHYRLAADRFPASAGAALLVAKTLRQTGHGKSGAEALSSFISRQPDTSAEMYSWLGIIRDETGDWKSGEQAHRQALLKTDADYLHNNLGYSLLMQGKKVEAAAEFRAALKLNPNSAVARDNLGVAVVDNRREAILNWQSVDEPAVAHSNLAALLIEQGSYAEARQELAIALEYNRANSAALTNLKLLSSLDGRPVTLPGPPSRQAAQSRWTRARAAMGQFWNGSRTPE